MYVETVGDRIRIIRRQRGLTRAKLARLAGTTVAELVDAEFDRIELPHETVKRIAAALWIGERYFDV